MARVSAAQREEYLQERREDILDAAVAVFASKGYDRANVLDIAETAEIAKGTVYLYFKSKRAILDAILAERTLLPRMTELMSNVERPVEQMLTEVSLQYVQFLAENLTIVRLVLKDAEQSPQHAERIYHGLIVRGTELLASYLAAQAKAGRIRKLDNPALTARALLGMLMTFVLTEELLGGKHLAPQKLEQWARHAVRLFIEGIEK